MAKTTVPGLYIADSAITAAKLNSTLDLTGKTITVATASSGDNDTTVASTAFVQQEIAALVDSSPSALNTLNELAAAIGDDASFSTTITNSIATKLALAGGTMTGDLIINTTGSLQIPVGTTAQRPTAAQGQLRFNTTTSKPEIYNGSAWADVGGGVESVNSATGVVTLDTDDISEGSTNLYFTNARADARIAAATTDDLSEGSTNLYFTTARANSAIDGRLSGSTGVTVSNGAISIGQDVATSTSPTFQNLTLSGTDSIKVPSGTTAQRSGSPANGMLRYNSSTNEFEGYANSAWGAIGGDTTSSVDLYTVTGDGTSDTYDTGKNPQSENNTWVFIGGVYQPKSTYSYSGTEITLSENLPNGEDLEVITGTVSTYNPTDAILGQYNATTSNTASYDTSLTTENENNVFVFIDGVYQPKSSYTYSGSTLTLDAVPTSGMSLEVLVTRSMNAATVTTGFLADDAVTTAKILNANVTADKLASSLDLTGKTVTVATASAGDNDTSVASTAFVRQEITSLVDSAPAAMDTLNELAAALGDDANFSTTVNASIAAKLPLAGGTLTGDLNFGDNDKAVFGAGSDLQIYHDGNNSYITDTGTGNLYIRASNELVLTSAAGEAFFLGIADGSSYLYHNGSVKLNTTSSGIDVTGTAVTDGLTVAGNVSVDGGTIKLDGDFPNGTENTAIGELALSSAVSTSFNVAIGHEAMADTTVGDRNTAVGWQSLHSNVQGDRNTAFGFATLQNMNSASANVDMYNTAVGYNTMNATTTGVNNSAVGAFALDANTTGNSNAAFGYSSLGSNTEGLRNVAMGAESLAANTTGEENTAVGYLALSANTTADANTAFGVQSLMVNTTGSLNAAFGAASLDANTTGSNNTAMGYGSLTGNTTASNNTAVGYLSLAANTTGASNTAVGESALAANTTASNNAAFGQDALAKNTEGHSNTGVGLAALEENTTADANTGIGFKALNKNTTASNNTAVGYAALKVNTTGASNTAVGGLSLDANTTGAENTSVGYASLSSNTTGTQSTAVGVAALESNTTGQNTALGFYAGRLTTTGDSNTAIGRYALASNTTGNDNIAIGTVALQTVTTSNCVAIGNQSQRYAGGTNNVSMGTETLRTSTGGNNTAVGHNALAVNTTGTANTAVGALSLDANTTGFYNVAVGYAALSAVNQSYNTAVGYNALGAATSGQQNTAVGYFSLPVMTTALYNTAIGLQSGRDVTTGSDNVFLGYRAGDGPSPSGSITTQSNRIVIGNNSSTHAYIRVSWTVTSDKRDKADIEPLSMGLDLVNKLNPVTYRWDMRSDYEDGNPDGTHKKEKLHGGLLAQDVEELEREYGYKVENETSILTDKNADGNYGLQYEKFVPVLINAVKELSSQVDELKAEIQTLKGE